MISIRKEKSNLSPANPATIGNLSWRVARQCNNGACVRVARRGEVVFIGDSKDPDGPLLTYTRAELEAFIHGVKEGDFDDLL